ncbi:MAG: FecR domain-containing protein [Pyrinomonadaceae bacterium]
MEEQKYRKFYLDWWRIRKSTIYTIVAILLIGGTVVGGGWYALRSNWFSQENLASAPKDAARIISFEGDVRIIRSATRETIVVTKETFVAAGDTVQTQGDGKATVQMIDGSVYSVKPNSTVVIRDNSSLLGGNNIRVALDDGQLNVRTDQQSGNTENVVEMSDSETRLKEQTDASFNADANENSGEIRISRGSVETTVGGQTQTINENEFASVQSGRLSSKEQLLPAPRHIAPANAAQISDSTGSGANVSFSWQSEGESAVATYQFQLARSAYFAPDSMLADRGSLANREFRLAGLAPGTYYWRSRATTRSGQTSDWSESWRFIVTRRNPTRVIEVNEWGVENVGGSVYMVTGRTTPGMLVRCLGREMYAANDGAFRLQISTPVSEVAVEFADDQGNRAGFVLSLRNARMLRRF